MSLLGWLTLAFCGVFALGVIVGAAIGAHEAHAEMHSQICTTEPVSAVSDLRRTRAPFGVSPMGRPWDDEID